MKEDADTPLVDKEPMEAAKTGRRIGTGFLFACFLVVCVFTAWQANRLWVAPTLRERPNDRGGEEAGFQMPAPDAGRFVHEPLSVAGLTRLSGDPAGISPPPEARRLQAFERRDGGQREQFATYETAADSPSVVEHYRSALSAAGFEPFGESENDGGRVLVFGRGDAQVLVGLRERPEKEKIKVTLSVILPAEYAGISGEEP